MNISDTTGFGEIDPNDKNAMTVLLQRLEMFRLGIVNQLRKEPTVFYVDPVAEPDKVAGAKPGDVAVWRDEFGTDRMRILGI